jgi:pyruvate/2-oxoglutarate/acetoin dehydrogenase E1 component
MSLAGAVRERTYNEALLEATDQALAGDERVYLMGLGVPDPKAIFGTTAGLQAKYGPQRVMDMPTAENGMTGVAIGSALVGMRPMMVHQRVDFTLLALDQVINNAAKWRYMFGGKAHVPIVIRMIVGRGWGQGPQHSQSLQATYAHIPGLAVLMPATPHDAKGLLLAAVDYDDPVIIIEHRWLQNTFGPVPEEPYRVPIGSANVVRTGGAATIVASSHMLVESLRAAEGLARHGIEAEVVDLRSIRPLDRATILASVRKTGRLVVVDNGWRSFGVAAEIVTTVTEAAFEALRRAPIRVTFPDGYVPTTPALAKHYYPTPAMIANAVRAQLELEPLDEATYGFPTDRLPDIPDPSFRGPF